VDIYEADHFQGRMRRLIGPQKLRRPCAKSIIVGPRATVLLSVRQQGLESVVKLKAKSVIPDLVKSVRGATIQEVAVVPQE
jgi:hypothetical protein